MGAPSERLSHWYADVAWLGEVAERVTIGVADGRIVSLTADSSQPADAVHLRGNDDPRSRERALPPPCTGRCGARTQNRASPLLGVAAGMMYDLVDPDSTPTFTNALARATYAEMTLAGITRPWASSTTCTTTAAAAATQNPNAMGGGSDRGGDGTQACASP